MRMKIEAHAYVGGRLLTWSRETRVVLLGARVRPIARKSDWRESAEGYF